MTTTTRHKIDATRSGTFNGMDFDVEYTIVFDFLPGAPNSHDEPGYGPEVDFVSISPDDDDHGVFSDLAQKHLREWAADWLDEHIDEVCAVVAADNAREGDEAADMRREERG